MSDVKKVKPGLLIVFEGNEGTGKTTLTNVLKEHLEKQNKKVWLLREPGGTGLGEELRNILVNNTYICPMTAALLFYASRTHLIKTIIKPALENGITVILDRYRDTSIVYQGLIGGYNDIRKLDDLVVKNLDAEPDVMIYLHCNAETIKDRLSKRNNNNALDELVLNNLDMYNDKYNEEMKKYEDSLKTAYIKINTNADIEFVSKELISSFDQMVMYGIKHGNLTKFSEGVK